jgi:hypothetical protein
MARPDHWHAVNKIGNYGSRCQGNAAAINLKRKFLNLVDVWTRYGRCAGEITSPQ